MESLQHFVLNPSGGLFWLTGLAHVVMILIDGNTIKFELPTTG